MNNYEKLLHTRLKVLAVAGGIAGFVGFVLGLALLIGGAS
jgi:hypothetical protein